jgi:hypothetical protein
MLVGAIATAPHLANVVVAGSSSFFRSKSLLMRANKALSPVYRRHSNCLRRRCFAVRILDFAVPSGMCSCRATSAAVKSKAAVSTTERSRTGERLDRADRISLRLSSSPSQSSRSQDSGVVPSQNSEGSSGIARFVRTQSKAALRAIVVTHASSDPRLESNVTPCLHARSRATCATSSAQPESPTIPNAIQHSRRQ